LPAALILPGSRVTCRPGGSGAGGGRVGAAGAAGAWPGGAGGCGRGGVHAGWAGLRRSPTSWWRCRVVR